MSSLEPESCEFLRQGLEEPGEFEKQCSKFADRMRHASSFELVQRIKSFINEFVGVQSSGSAEQSSQMVRRYVEEMASSLREHPLWKDDGEEDFNWAVEALEKYLMSKLYKVTFYLPSTSDSEDDDKFYHRVRVLQFLKPEHFDLPERPLNRVATEMAADELVRIDDEKLKSPREKLTCILNCIAMLSNLLKHYGEEQGTGADDLLPYLIYTILLLSPEHIHSNLRYISRFRRESQMTSEAAYYFTQMESAVMFILEANHKNLSISEEEFKQSMEQAEENIQSGLDIHQFMPRSRPSRSRVSSLMLVTPPPSPSPMMSRRTTVIEEWSQLQRTRSLSQSKSDRGEKQGVSGTKSSPVAQQQGQGQTSLSGSDVAPSSKASDKQVWEEPDSGTSGKATKPSLGAAGDSAQSVIQKYLTTRLSISGAKATQLLMPSLKYLTITNTLFTSKPLLCVRREALQLQRVSSQDSMY